MQIKYPVVDFSETLPPNILRTLLSKTLERLTKSEWAGGNRYICSIIGDIILDGHLEGFTTEDRPYADLHEIVCEVRARIDEAMRSSPEVQEWRHFQREISLTGVEGWVASQFFKDPEVLAAQKSTGFVIPDDLEYMWEKLGITRHQFRINWLQQMIDAIDSVKHEEQLCALPILI